MFFDKNYFYKNLNKNSNNFLLYNKKKFLKKFNKKIKC